MRSRVVLPVAALTVLALTGCGAAGPQDSDAEDDGIVIGVPASIQGRELDPHQTAGGHAVSTLYSMFETLYELDESGVPQPNIVESDDVSEDGLTVTMTLKEGLTFHDGSDLTADDVVFSIDRARGADESLESTTSMGALSLVTDVRATDDRTVTITLSEPDPILRNTLSYFGGMIVPSDYIEEVGTDGFIEHPIGSGPYKFDSSSPTEVKLSTFDDYGLDDGGSYRTVTLRVLEEPATRIAQLTSGDIDFAFDVEISQAATLEDQDYTVISNPSGQNLSILINSDQPIFDDPNVAVAMNLAVDRQTIVDEIYQGHASITTSPDPSMSTDDVAPFEYDVDAAQALLDETAYAGETLILDYPAGRYPQDQQLVQTIQSNLADIGMSVELRAMDSAQWLEGLRDNSLDDMTLTMNTNQHWDSFQSLNDGTTCDGTWSLYCNPEHDEVLAEIAPLEGEERRAQIVSYSELLHDEPTGVYLLMYHQVYGMDSSITWTPTPGIRTFDFSDIAPTE